MKYQTHSNDVTTESFDFEDTKNALLKACHTNEDAKHPVVRIRYKITFYWK